MNVHDIYQEYDRDMEDHFVFWAGKLKPKSWLKYIIGDWQIVTFDGVPVYAGSKPVCRGFKVHWTIIDIEGRK